MTATGSLATLFAFSMNRDFSLSLTAHPALFVVLCVAVLFYYFVRWRLGWWTPNFTIDGAEFGTGMGKITLKPNLKDQEIAYKIWVELSTRKIGLKIDLKHDVIVEIYDSWHDFFSITRELIKDIPVNKVKNESTRRIITLSVAVLNEGMRPHLTSWQARFRRWYERQLENKGDDADPQAIQEKYPHFEELSKDILQVNDRLMKYREKMRELVLGLDIDETSGNAASAMPAL